MKKSVLPFVSRKLVGLMTILSFIFLFSACSDSDPVSETASPKSYYKCPTCKTNPEALPQNDNSNKGIYFGILKEGAIFIDIDNRNDGQVFVRLNNSTDSVLNLENSSYDEDGYMAVFSGTINHAVTSFVFKVGTDGSNPTISFLDASGKRIASDSFVYKEKSNAMVEVFEGNMKKRAIVSSDEESTDKPRNGFIPPVNFELMGNVSYLFSRATNEWSLLKIKADNSVETNHGRIDGSQLIDENERKAGTLVSDQVNQVIDLPENGRIIIDAFRVL